MSTVTDKLAEALRTLVANGGIGPESMFGNAREALAEYEAAKLAEEKRAQEERAAWEETRAVLRALDGAADRSSGS